MRVIITGRPPRISTTYGVLEVPGLRGATADWLGTTLLRSLVRREIFVLDMKPWFDITAGRAEYVTPATE
jgi:hypothetical protein